MKRLINIALVLAVVLSANVMAQPKLEIEGGKTYDWGDVKPDDSPLHAKIKLYNKGDELLKIKEVKPSCGCTTAPLDKKEVKPGDYATLDVSLKVEHYSGDIQKTVKITTNSLNSREVLFLKCNVKRPFKLFPRILSFNRMYIGEESSGKIVLNNMTEKPMVIESVEVTPENMHVNLSPGDEIPAGGSYPIEASYTPKTTEPFSGMIKIKTNIDEINEGNPQTEGVISVKAWGRIVGERKTQSSK